MKSRDLVYGFGCWEGILRVEWMYNRILRRTEAAPFVIQMFSHTMTVMYANQHCNSLVIVEVATRAQKVIHFDIASPH